MHLDRAAEETGDDAVLAEIAALRGECLVTSALSEFLAAGQAAGLERLLEAEALLPGLRPVAAERLRMLVLFQRASIRARSGDRARALDDVAEVIAHLGAFDAVERSAVLMSYGLMMAEVGRPRDASALFGRAKEAAALAANPGMMLAAQHDEAYAVYLAGDLPRAMALMVAAEGSMRDSPEAVVHLDHGLLLLECGLAAEALVPLELAVRSVRRRSQGSTLAEAYLELARAHRLVGDTARAVTAVRRSRALCRRLGLEAAEARAVLLDLQLALDAGRSTLEMVEVADGLVRVGISYGDRALTDRAATVGAEILARRRDWPAARLRLTQVPSRRSGSLQGALHRYYVEAVVRAGEGDRVGARRALRQGADRLGAGRVGSASLDLRAATALHGVRLARLDLQTALEDGAPAVVASLERWRSATDRLPSVRPQQDAELAELTEQLRVVLDRLRGESNREEVARLGRRADHLRELIRRRDWSLAHDGSAAVEPPPSLPEARRTLVRHDRDFVWLFPHQSRLLAVVIRSGRTSLVDLAPLAAVAELGRRVRADLLALATRNLGPLAGAVRGSLAGDIRRLDDLVLRPCGSRAAGLVLIPSSELAGVPWALAPSLAGRPLTIARSLGGWARRTGKSAGRPTLHVSVGPRLDRARLEAAGVADAWGGDGVEVASPATASGLVHAVTAADVVHVAAHGTHEPQSPLFSSIELDDGQVFAHEFQPRGIRARHVVLSACDVGTATVRPGEEALGLAASMLSLGAASVVAAVSPIPDDVACEVMTAHHRHLAAGRSTDEALALAIAAGDPVAAAFHSMGSQWQFGSHPRD